MRKGICRQRNGRREVKRRNVDNGGEERDGGDMLTNTRRRRGLLKETRERTCE